MYGFTMKATKLSLKFFKNEKILKIMKRIKIETF